MARIKYTTPRKRYTDLRRHHEQPAQLAQLIIPMEIEVIELSDDVHVVELSDDTAHTLEVADGIEVSDATTTYAKEVKGLAQPDENMLDEEGLGDGFWVNLDIVFESDESMGFVSQ